MTHLSGSRSAGEISSKEGAAGKGLGQATGKDKGISCVHTGTGVQAWVGAGAMSVLI